MNSIEERMNKNKFQLFDAALATLLFIIYNFIFLEIYRALPRNFITNEFVYFVASFLIELLFGVAAFTVAKIRRYRFFETTGAKNKVNGKLVGLGFAISVICIFFFSNLTDIFLEILQLLGYKLMLSNLVIDTFWRFLAYILVSCVTPAICEELLFRGTILSGLKSLGAKAAVILSALIFTLMHGNAEQTVHQFIIGLIIGYIFLKTGNVWIGIIIHFFNNFIAVTMTYVTTLIQNSGAVNVVESTETAGVNVMGLILNIVFAVVLALLGAYIIKTITKKVISENEKLNGNKANENVLGETTINIDGQDVSTTMTIDGETVNAEEEHQVQENLGANSEEKPKKVPIASIILFTISGLYLVYEWVASLITGFMI